MATKATKRNVDPVEVLKASVVLGREVSVTVFGKDSNDEFVAEVAKRMPENPDQEDVASYVEDLEAALLDARNAYETEHPTPNMVFHVFDELYLD